MNVFDAAARYLQDKGWQKGSSGGQGYPACLVGAICEVAEESVSQIGTEVFKQISDVITEQYPEYAGRVQAPCANIAVFNDDRKTTLEDVLLVLDKAGRKLDEAA
jgi:hypothetical protein